MKLVQPIHRYGAGSALLLFSVLLGLSACKEKSHSSNDGLLALFFLNRGSANLTNADGSTTLVAPGALSFIPPASASASASSAHALKADAAKGLFRSLGTIGDGSTDYDRDMGQVWVADPAAQVFSMADTFLKAADATGYKWLVGKGPVKVQFSPPFASSPSSNGGAQQASKLTWTVQADYTSGQAPLVVKIWGPLGVGSSGLLTMKLTIREGVSAGNPYGDFDMLVGLSAVGAPSTAILNLSIKTVPRADGKTELQMVYDNMGLQNRLVALVDHATDSGAVAYDTDFHTWNSSGPPTVLCTGTGRMIWDASNVYSAQPCYPTAFNASYEPTAFETKNYGLSRQNPDVVVHSYGLYNAADGSRKKLTTGFPVLMLSGAAAGKQGYASSWGLSVWSGAEQIPVSAGDTLQVQRYDGTVGDQYSVAISNGRLSKSGRNEIPVSDLENVPLILSEWDSGTGNTKYFVVSFLSGTLKKLKDCGNTWPSGSGAACTAVSGNVTYPTWGGVYLYFASYAGPQRSLQHNAGSPTATSWTFEEVDSVASTLTLYDYSEAQSFCYSDYTTVAAKTKVYSVDNATLELKNSITGVTETQGKYGLLASPITVNSQADCQKLYNSGSTATTSYSWYPGQSGLSYTQRTRLKKADGSIFAFDKPLYFIYSDSTGVYDLGYYGFGSLSVPWIQDAAPSTYMPSRPAFTLANGTVLTTLGTSYVVKQLLTAQVLKASSADMTDLASQPGPALPVAGPVDNPGIGPEPTTDGKIYAIDGQPTNVAP